MLQAGPGALTPQLQWTVRHEGSDQVARRRGRHENRTFHCHSSIDRVLKRICVIRRPVPDCPKGPDIDGELPTDRWAYESGRKRDEDGQGRTNHEWGGWS